MPPVEVELPVPLADGALLEADGLVLALPLAVVPVPGALSLIVPLPLVVEAVVELLAPAGAVVVVVVVVVAGADPLAVVLEPLVPEELPEPLMPEVLLVLAELLDQSPCTLTE